MPPAKQWTEQADQTIRQMRGSGQTWSAIGVCLGLSRNTVIERGRRLCALAPKRAVAVAVVKIVSDDPNRGALPAGHPLTWGLLSDEPFPGLDGRDENFFDHCPAKAESFGGDGPLGEQAVWRVRCWGGNYKLWVAGMLNLLTLSSGFS